MSDNTLSAKVSVSADASPVQKLIKVLGSLEKVLAQAANTIPAATEALALFGGAVEATTEASAKAGKAAADLNKSLGDSSGVQGSTQNLQAYVKTVNELRVALGKPQVAPKFFPDTKSAAAEIKVLEDELLKLLNVYRTSFGQKELLREAFTTEGAIRELNALKTQIDTTLTRIDVPRDAVTVATELRQEIDKLSQSSATASPLALLADLQDNRAEALKTIDTIEQLKLQLIEIGPSARDGNEQAVQQFGKLSNKLNEAEGDARRLTSILQDTSKVFDVAVGGPNLELSALGFRQIKLEDIFPSSEQAKVAQLGERINAEIVKSVTQGAVQQSINTLLRSADQTQKLNNQVFKNFTVFGRNAEDLPNVQLGDISERSLQNLVQLTNHLPRLRYALYDTSNTVGIFGAGLLGLSVGAIKVAADFERSFADVDRVTGLSVDGTRNLRNALIDLSKEIPASFEEITGIATLAGQLNVAEGSIANFTESVAKFAATTDVTVDASATAFGRLDQLVAGVDGQFDKLGSSILAVGVNSVATESEIIKIAGQIASIANIAGFSAGELIGFSAALASVGTRPELSRGTFTRLFSEINEAVTQSTDSLDKFARLAGQSSEEFIDAWTAGRGADQIVEILRGLSVQGAEAELSLRALGITSVRDIPTLLKLAQSVEEVEKQIAIATVGFLAGTELQEQYSVISSTLSEKLVVLKNNFQALTASLAGATGPITVVVDLLIGLIGILESIIRNPVAQAFLTTVIAIKAIAGAAAIAASGLIRFGASMAGALTSLIEVRSAIAVTQLSVAGLNTSINSTTAAAGAATAAVGGLATATSGLGIASGITAGATGIGAANEGIRAFFASSGKAGASTNKLSTAIFGLFKNTKLAAGIKLAAPFLGWTGVALGLVSLIDYVGRSFGAWGAQVETTIDDIGPYLEAAKQDTADWASSTDSVRAEFETFIPAISGAEGAIDDYVKMIMIANGEEDLLNKLINSTTGELEAQTVAIGKNTQALIRQDVVKKMMADAETQLTFGFLPLGDAFGVSGPELRMNEAMLALQSVITNPELSQGLKDLGFDFAEMVRLISSGSTEAANAMGVTMAAAAAEMADALEEADPERHALEIDQLRKIAQYGAPALQRYNSIFDDTVESLKATTFEAFLAGEGMTSLEEDVSDASDAMTIFEEKFSTAFGDVNAIKKVNDALIGLDSSIQENGTSFDNLSANGNANLIALQLAIFATIENAQALGLDTAGAIALVFQQLVNSGVSVASAFALAAQAGGAIGIQVTGVEQLTNALAGLAGTYGVVDGAARDAGGGAQSFADRARELTSSLFENANATRSTEDAIFALGEAFGEGGNEALYAGEEMQGAIDAILSSSGNGEQAVANLASLFIKLANTVGSQTDPSLGALRQTINAVAQQFGITTVQVEQFIKTAGGGLANINLDNFNRGIQNAQKEVRTLIDYASDLSGIFNRAFDIRFSRMTAIDDLAASWDSVGQRIQEARFDLEELAAAQNNLTADRAIKQYFLSVAEQYGDELRAAQLREELAEMDRQRQENERRLEEAQQIAGGDLTEQGSGSRENRQALLGLVQQYQEYITALAESGATQQELTAATTQARAEFIQQATELGFQETVVLEYAQAFDDVQTAISKVERNITVEANVNPALQALNELNASLNKNIQAARNLNAELGRPNRSSGTVSGGPATQTEVVPGQQPGATQNAAELAQLKAELDSARTRFDSINRQIDAMGWLDRIVNPNKFRGLQANLESARRVLEEATINYNTARGFAMGGYTGPGARNEPAGIVHKGEYVIPKQFVNQSTGMPDPSFLAQLQNGMRSYQMGGFVGGGDGVANGGTMMVELSPFDRKLLADAGNVQLRLNGKVVAEATNRSNFNDAQRGTN
jgi:TP901 family phage tail tape measure protein